MASVDLNVIERAFAVFAPEWGVRRLGAKFNLGIVREQVRGYDGAAKGRRGGNWRAGQSGPNAELAPALPTLIARARDLDRNNEWAKNARMKLMAHIVGPGFIYRPGGDRPIAQKKRAQAAWDAFCENCDPQNMADFAALQAREVSEIVMGGACFRRWFVRDANFGLKIPLQCEILQHEHLDLSKNQALDDGGIILNGVEFDRYGRRVAYWLYPNHPGDWSIALKPRFIAERVSAEYVDHIFKIEQAGQVTGIPWLAVTMMRLRDAADYEVAHQLMKKINASITGFRETPMDAAPASIGGASLRQEAQGSTAREAFTRVQPGTIVDLSPGQKMTLHSPAASGGDDAYMAMQLRAAAAGVGLTDAQFSLNLAGANYTSMREGKLDFWAMLDQHQLHMMIPQSCRPAWRRVMKTAAALGDLKLADMPVEITPPRRQMVKPLEDIRAAGMAMQYGLESWDEMVSAWGYDPEEHLARLKVQNERLAEAGVHFTQAGSAQPDTMETNNGA